MTSHLAVVPARAFDDKRMGPELIQLLGVMCSYTSRTGWCRPAQGTLAERLGVHRTTINRNVRRLRDFGYIEVHARFRADGGQAGNFYRVIYDTELATEHYRMTPPDEDMTYPDPPPPVAPVLHPPVAPKNATPPVAPKNATPPVAPKNATAVNGTIERYQLNDTSLAPIGASPPRAREAATPREREYKTPQGYGWIEEHSLYPALAAHFPTPGTRSERGRWARVLAELGEVGATPAQVHQFVRRWHEQHPNANAHTIMAVVGNWTPVLEGNTRNGTDQRNLETQSAAATERYERGQAQMAAIFAGLGDLLPQRTDAAR